MRGGYFWPGFPSFWILEGLLPYQKREVSDELFCWIVSQSSPESGLAFDYFHLGDCSPAYLETFRQRVEPVDPDSQWTPSQVKDLLAARGLGNIVHRSIDEIKQVYPAI